MTGKPKPRPVPDLTPSEKARRNAALEQAWRIRAYLPKLRAREEALEHVLAEIKKLIKDELAAFDELSREAHPDTQRDGERVA